MFERWYNKHTRGHLFLAWCIITTQLIYARMVGSQLTRRAVQAVGHLQSPVARWQPAAQRWAALAVVLLGSMHAVRYKGALPRSCLL